MEGGFVQLESELPVTSVAKTSNACGLSPFLGPSTKRIVNLLCLMYLLQLVISSDSLHICASSADVCVNDKKNIPMKRFYPWEWLVDEFYVDDINELI